MSHFNKSIIINGYDNDNALALAIGFTGVCFLKWEQKKLLQSILLLLF